MTGHTHRNDTTTRDSQIISGISVYATRYNTGRTDVQIYAGAPSNPEQAAALFN